MLSSLPSRVGVSFAVAPAGYAVEEAYYFEGDATEMTITLKKG